VAHHGLGLDAFLEHLLLQWIQVHRGVLAEPNHGVDLCSKPTGHSSGRALSRQQSVNNGENAGVAIRLAAANRVGVRKALSEIPVDKRAKLRPLASAEGHLPG
jgi:hypothetical protein